MAHSPGKWRLSNITDAVITDPTKNTPQGVIEYYGGSVIAESISSDDDRELIAQAPIMKQNLTELAEVIARNLTAWDTSKDNREGLLPEVYWSNRVWYERLTGEKYSFRKAVKKFNIE
ncbi:hypothetical protein [Metabacillus sp. FJAT-53654]|uniref:Uncharacterized protein n=1 Tax=Metabacillus rhizosphaerae TaxID=3117747 RepID=A0ABZ2MZ37_9BACI